jgi:hypothetical protein
MPSPSPSRQLHRALALSADRSRAALLARLARVSPLHDRTLAPPLRLFNLPSPCHLIQIPCAQDLPWRLSSCTTHIELSCTPTVANFEFLTAEQLAAGNRARLGVSRYAPVALRVVVSLAHLNLLVLLLALDSSEAQPETWRRGHVRPERRRSDCSHVVGPSRPSLAPTGFAASTAVSPRCFLATAAPPLARRSAKTVAPPHSSAWRQR